MCSKCRVRRYWEWRCSIQFLSPKPFTWWGGFVCTAHKLQSTALVASEHGKPLKSIAFRNPATCAKCVVFKRGCAAVCSFCQAFCQASFVNTDNFWWPNWLEIGNCWEHWAASELQGCPALFEDSTTTGQRSGDYACLLAASGWPKIKEVWS